MVGVDGSDHSHCALVWAAREAERRRRPLHIVTAYSVPIFAASGLDGGYATVDDSVIREGAEAILKHAVDKVAGYHIDVDASVENGDASGVLLEISPKPPSFWSSAPAAAAASWAGCSAPSAARCPPTPSAPPSLCP